VKKTRNAFALLATCLVFTARLFLAREVTDQTKRRVNVPDHPARLVSLAPSITEIVYALGLADRLVGDTDYCDYPPEARRKPHVGSLLNPSLENIVALKPDLVLGTPEANRREVVDQLERLGIPLYGVTAHSLEDTLGSIDDLARVLGGEAEAHRLVRELRIRIAAVEQRVRDTPRPRVLFVVWYQPLVTAGPNSFIADVIRRAGGVSISDDLRGDWPRLSLEEVVRRDPEVILFPHAESFSPGLEEIERLPVWKELSAVKQRRVYFISDAINRQTPRLVDALEEVARALHPGAAQNAEKDKRSEVAP
jgi:iron complex transport system substrate-binding protein